MFIASAVVVGHILVAPMFCEGKRSAETQNGMSYHAWYKDYALDTVSQQKIQDAAEHTASVNGLPNFHEIGLQAREAAKAQRAEINSTYAKLGQKVLCGKTSDNWND